MTRMHKLLFILLALLLCIFIGIIAFFVDYFNGSHTYTLVGEGYIVKVNKKMFDAFGEGEFSDLDLDRFAERYELEKLYFNDTSAMEEAGVLVFRPSDNPIINQKSESME